MFPATLVGIVFFVAGAGPGYLYVQLAERYGPRRDRSTLEEAAELLVVGSIATGAAFLIAIRIAGIDAAAVERDAGRYVLEQPLRVLLVLGSTLVLSHVVVWTVTTKIAYRGKPREIQPGGSMWYAAFRSLVPEGHGTLVTIERKDGSALTGLLGSATADESPSREILVIAPENRPIYARASRNSVAQGLSDTFVIIRAEDIDLIAGVYLPVTATASAE